MDSDPDTLSGAARHILLTYASFSLLDDEYTRDIDTVLVMQY